MLVLNGGFPCFSTSSVFQPLVNFLCDYLPGDCFLIHGIHETTMGLNMVGGGGVAAALFRPPSPRLFVHCGILACLPQNISTLQIVRRHDQF